MRPRILLAVLFVAVVTGASVAYSYAAPKRYDATARVVVHPIPAGGDTYTGIDVLFDSRDQARVIETAGHYFDTPDVVNRVDGPGAYPTDRQPREFLTAWAATTASNPTMRWPSPAISSRRRTPSGAIVVRSSIPSACALEAISKDTGWARDRASEASA